jgi:predicted dehydrogenase
LAEHPPQSPASRRDFLKTSAAVAGATLTAGLAVPPVHAGGGDVIRVGLVGCGGRGTGAAAQALSADKGARLIAMGDAFADRLEESLKGLKENKEIADRITVTPEMSFTGFNAYKQVIANVDVVLLATPPHFRPMHLAAAVGAGKHVFCEKPMAVDAPGVRAVLAACDEAKKKRLSIVSGFCWRRDDAMRETMQRLHDGAIGDILTLQCTYNTGELWHHDRQPGWSDMEWQLRNWLYFTWLSGDHNVEQHVHSLDKMAWAMKDEHPVKAVGLGGRQSRTASEFGNIFDHHAVVYEYANGARLFSSCRQQKGCGNDVSDRLVGSKGVCDVVATIPPRVKITGPSPWTHNPRGSERDAYRNMYQNEHDELFASIRSGKPINDGDWMARSTLMAIMGRMATYTGQVITWDMALNSREDLTPPKYDMAASLPVPPVARPGITRFV